MCSLVETSDVGNLFLTYLHGYNTSLYCAAAQSVL